MLRDLKLGGGDVEEIVTHAKSGNYQVACLRHFEVTHPDMNRLPEFRVDVSILLFRDVLLPRVNSLQRRELLIIPTNGSEHPPCITS